MQGAKKVVQLWVDETLAKGLLSDSKATRGAARASRQGQDTTTQIGNLMQLHKVVEVQPCYVFCRPHQFRRDEVGSLG